jgi:hypothetical protein
MSHATTDQALLERLGHAITAAEPDPADCEALADRLMAAGAAAAAARWRSWSLLPPPPPDLLQGLGEAVFLLSGDPPLAVAEAARLGEGWRQLVAELDRGAPPPALEAALGSLLREPLPSREVVDDLASRLEEAGANRAALVLLQTLWQRWPAALPPEPVLCNRLARLQRRCGDERQAELWCRLSLRLLPAQPLVWFQLAKALLEQGAGDEALECAEAGLTHAPGHPWGLKLRAHCLAASGGWHSVAALARLGGLPADPEFLGRFVVGQERFARVLERLRPPSPPPLPLEARLRLRQRLRHLSGPLVLVHGRGAGCLLWLWEQELLPPSLVVHPLASRDPCLVAERLSRAGLQVRPEGTLRQLAELEEPPALLVLERPAAARLPLALGLLLRQGAPILAVAGWLELPQRPQERHGGWQWFEAWDNAGHG